jgi:hypothetical protein
MENVTIFPSNKANSTGVPGWGVFNFQFLAQGDSWFSTSTLKGKRSNLLENMLFPEAAAVVNCADPGDTLTHMVDLRRDPLFNSLLCGPKQQPWVAIFLSGGGNDLIDAVQTPPVINGAPVTPHDRLVLTEQEWGGPFADPANRYISKEGWDVFRTHLEQQYRILDSLRAQSRDNAQTPIFTHTYDYATPRDSGAGFDIGPWLYPALTLYKIPSTDWNALADAFIDKLSDIIIGIGQQLSNFHVVDTRKTLLRAAIGATGVSNDWQNEIHATASGYGKIGNVMVPRICGVIGMSGMPTLAQVTTPAASLAGPIAVPPAVAAAAQTTGRNQADKRSNP